MMNKKKPTIEEGYALAVKRLYRGDCSAWEITAWLRRRGCKVEDAQAVLSRLLEHNYINDERLCVRICDNWLAEKTSGKRFLQAKLTKRGIEKNIIAEKLAELDFDEYEAARAVFLIYTKRIKKVDEKSLPKILRQMAARGFSYSIAARLVDENKELFQDSTVKCGMV